ncbi:MAG: ABC transporter ATP-binding protein/permease [Treponemataceae bacterium]|nr:ABC transporter ATP-binding protein/permease [Treponemataceae bacterium]
MIKIRLIRLLSHAKKYVVLQVLWQWISLIAQVQLIFCLSGMIAGLFENTLPAFEVCIPVILGCISIRFLMEWLTSRTSYKASVDVKKILRSKIYEKLLRLGSAYRENVHTAEVVQLASEGVEQLEIYFGKYLSQFFYSLICPLTLFVILSFVNLRAATVLLICVPLIPLSIVVVMKIANRLLKNYWGLYAELGDSFLENLQGLTTLKIYQADEKKAREMDAESQKFRHVTMKVLTMQLNSTSVMDIMAYGGAAVGMIVTLMQFRAGNVDLQGALMIILLAAEFFIPLRLLGSFFHVAMNGMAASDKIFALLDLPEPEEKTGQVPKNVNSIRFENVSFSYNKERTILQNINIECRPGITSFVGVSGSGKSTVARILMGRNKEYEGKVVVESAVSEHSRMVENTEGVELQSVSESSIMKNIVLVNHESCLFKGTIRDNLLMAKSDANDTELETVLSKVNLLEFVTTNGGLDYHLDEAASNLSGGQKQRLALARTLLHNPHVYIFDEATSNIDSESEEKIMQVIHELAKTKIVILISHRLANVVNSNQIYFLQNGKIIENGNHQQLLEVNGEYSKLYQKQKELEDFAGGAK